MTVLSLTSTSVTRPGVLRGRGVTKLLNDHTDILVCEYSMSIIGPYIPGIVTSRHSTGSGQVTGSGHVGHVTVSGQVTGSGHVVGHSGTVSWRK